MADKHREASHIFKAPAKFIRALVGQRGQEATGEHEPIGHVDIAHIKAKALGKPRLLTVGLDHLVEKLLGGSLAVFPLTAVAGHKFRQNAVGGVIALDDVHIRQNEIAGLGAVIVYGLGDLREHMLVGAVRDIQTLGVYICRLDGVVPLAGDDRRTGFGLVAVVGDERFRGPFLRRLHEMGIGGRGDKAVAENHVVDFDRG